MSAWKVCDEYGAVLIDGLQDADRARQAAQELANAHGETVWLSQSVPDGIWEEIDPIRTSIADAAGTLLADALEIAASDPDFATVPFAAFCAVMWPDDRNMVRWGMDRGDFARALREAWQKLARWHERGA